jgi:DNA mismatch repair protein MutL
LLRFHTEGQTSAAKAQSGESAAQKLQTSNFKLQTPEPAKPPPEERTLPNFTAALHPKTSESATRQQQPALKMGFGSAVPTNAPEGEHPAATPSPAAPAVSSVVSPTPKSAPSPAATPTAPAPRGLAPAVPLLSVPMRIVGVVGRLYVVLESDRGLVLLDQHAAHERVLFEQMLNRVETHQQAPSQRLLLPETIEVSVRDAQFLREQLSALTRLGVGLSEFGERTFLLDALPPFVKVSEPRKFVLELVDQLKAAGAEVNSARLGELTIAKTVCRHAVKANDPLAGPELENLLEELRHCAMPYSCPHGRPTLIEMNFRELEKKFGRSA